MNAVVIPAYRPSSKLIDLIRNLSENGRPAIFLVDDGSGAAFDDVFRQAAGFPNVRLARHAANRGKGAALKTGMELAAGEAAGLSGVVTADADGQHHPDDIRRVTQALDEHPDSLILGSREFQGKVPLRSRFGNVLTRGLVHALVGQKLRDTQTGLRGIPARLVPRLLKLEANGYEFELEMLLAAREEGVPVVEVPIRTIYEEGNRSSHFHPLVDSMKIYFVLLRFTSASLLTAALDNLVFYLAYRQTGWILESQILGRMLAVAFNYWMVRTSVFYSRERHRTVLPKYLALVVCSGTASYGGIRLLAARGMYPVAAKLLVETGLFFVNFAVQRSVIFRPRAGKRERIGALAVVTAAVLAVVVGVEIYGFAGGHLWQQLTWFPNGAKRLLRYGCVFVEFAFPILLAAPWLFAGLVTAAVAAGTLLAAGPQALLATAFFLLSANALGTRLLGRRKGAAAFATLCGAAVYIFVMNLVARAPVNYAAVWGVALAIPIAADLRGVRERLRDWAAALRGVELRRGWERVSCALLVFVLGMHWLVALKPETGADGLAMHLAIPVQVAAHHRLLWEPGRILWSVMPMGADWAYTIVYLLGGEAATHLLNLAMLLLLLAMLYSGARRWVSRAAAMFLAAVFATTPLVQLVTGSLFVENLLAAMLFGTLAALWCFGESGEKRWLWAAATLAGTALTTKLGAFAVVLPALPFAVWLARKHWKALGQRPAVACALAAGILIAAAAPPYAIAYAKTGNPVFPFLNERFPSPVLDHSAVTTEFRFRQPLGWRTPYDLTFHTHLFYEGQDGSLGFQYLGLAALAIVAALALRTKNRLAAAGTSVCALVAAAIVLANEPNARYLYPAMALLFVPFAALLGWARERAPWLAGTLVAFAMACAALNIWFMPCSGWYQRDFYSQEVFARGGRERFLRDEAPVRDVALHYRALPSHPPILLAADIDLADVAYADAYSNNWHQWNTWHALHTASSVGAVLRLVQQSKIEYFLARRQKAGAAIDPTLLGDFLETCTDIVYERKGYYLSRLDATCGNLSEAALDERAAQRPLITVGPGMHDDIDPEIRLRGAWDRGDFDEAYNKTVSYTNAPGAEAVIAFQGRAVTWLFTKAPNRGIAEVQVDGVTRGVVDLYSKTIEWQAKEQFDCASEARHVLTIRVLGRRSGGATDNFVDVDGFSVEK